jgi:hypothetical protein
MTTRVNTLNYLLQQYLAGTSPVKRSAVKAGGSEGDYEDIMSILKPLKSKTEKIAWIRNELQVVDVIAARPPSPVARQPSLPVAAVGDKRATLVQAAISVYSSGAAMSWPNVKKEAAKINSGVALSKDDYEGIMSVLKPMKSKEQKIAHLQSLLQRGPSQPRQPSPQRAVVQERETKTILDSEEDVPRDLQSWAFARDIRVIPGMTKEKYCDEVFGAVVKDQSLNSQRQAEYDNKISSLQSQLETTQKQLENTLEELRAAQESAKKSGDMTTVTALQTAAQSLSDAAEEVQGAKEDAENLQQALHAEASGTAAVCNVLNSWSGDALSEDAAADLSCPTGSACDVASKTCVTPTADVVEAPVMESADVVPVVLKSCFTEEKHGSLESLMGDLDCGSDMVCDVTKKQCVKNTGDVDEVFIGGKSIRVTGENRSIVVDAIKREIAALSASSRPLNFAPIKPGDRPISLAELQAKFKSLNVRAAPSFSEEQARKAYSELKGDLAKALRK